MTPSADGLSWTFDLVLGENRWEQFHLLQDHNPRRRISPYAERASKGTPCVGPHSTTTPSATLTAGLRATVSSGSSASASRCWQLDARDRVDVPDEDIGVPGDWYRITFKWNDLKELTWEKLVDKAPGTFGRGRYYAVGSWADWNLGSGSAKELFPDESREPGWFASEEIMITATELQFQILRDEDWAPCIYPLSVGIRGEVAAASVGGTGDDLLIRGPEMRPALPSSMLNGSTKSASSKHWWQIQTTPGRAYRIFFYRDPEDVEPTGMRVTWAETGEGPNT